MSNEEDTVSIHELEGLTFTSSEELRRISVEHLDVVEEDTTEVRGVTIPEYKSLNFRKDGSTATIVRRTYTPIQNRISIMQAARTLEKEGIEFCGTLTQTKEGHMVAKFEFTNPEYNSHALLGLTPSTGYVRIGLRIENSYGIPVVSFNASGRGYNPSNGAQYDFSAQLGRRSVRHIGKIETTVLKAVEGLTKNAPKLAKHIDEAIEYRFEDKSVIEAVVRGLGWGPRHTAKLMVHARVSGGMNAWQLFDLMSEIVSRKSIKESNRDRQLKALTPLLQTSKIPRIQAKGERILEDEALGIDANQKNLDVEV